MTQLPPNDPTHVYFAGQLEIDLQRGVIYFHDSNTGISRLRICRLNPEALANVNWAELGSIDITCSKTTLVGFVKD